MVTLRFLTQYTESIQRERKFDKIDFIQMKSFWTLRDTVKKNESASQKLGKIFFAKHVSEKDLYLEYIKNSYNSNIRSQTPQ